MTTTTEPLPRRIKFTGRVRRGLDLMASLVADAFDDRRPPAATVVARWTKAQRAELELATQWVAQLSPDAPAEGGAA